MSAGGAGVGAGAPSSSAAMAGPEALGGASSAGGALGGSPGFNYMAALQNPMMGQMGQGLMQSSKGTPPQMMVMPMMLPPMPQGGNRNLPPPNFPNMAPPKSPVQTIAGQAIQNMDPMSFDALIHGLRMGMRR